MKVEIKTGDGTYQYSFEIIPWSTPSSELISPKILEHLRDDHPEEIISNIQSYDIATKLIFVKEIAVHGNWQKAAIVLRDIYEKIDDRDRVEIFRNFGDINLLDILMVEDGDLLLLPRRGGEIARYLQRKLFS